MPLDSPFLVYGVVSLNGSPYNGAVVSIQDTTLSSAVLTATSDVNGQYNIDIQTIATDGDNITVWCDLGTTIEVFILNIAGAMEEVNLSYTITAYITLTQTPISKNLYLYPNGDWTSCCTAVGASNNYECVDDISDLPDDDNTYVWHNRSTMCTDMYTLPDHTIESGIINYVRVYARAKSHQYQQASTGSYRILAKYSGTTSRQACILTTDYNIFSYVLTSTPSGGTWNWNAIDALRIGFDCKSPSYRVGTSTKTLRPNGNGIKTEWTTRNYTNIDELIADDDSTYDYYLNGFAYNYVENTYGFEDYTSALPPDAVNVYFSAKAASGDGWFQLAPYMILGASKVTGTIQMILNSYSLKTQRFTTDPGGGAWSWADVNSTEYGVSAKLVYEVPDGWIRLTQMYIVVEYPEQVYPEVRTTQMYALVNYTPDTEYCHLNQPINYSISNNRKVCIVQPERGDRVVYDLCRESKVLTLMGIEYDTDISTATTRLRCVRDQKDNGQYITISGVGDDKIDTTWLITDFTYNRNEQNQRIWNWVLTAEKYESG